MNDRWLTWLLPAIALLGSAGRAQTPSSNAPGAQTAQVVTLTGTVYDSVSNAPIAHALVELPGQSTSSAFTGADGRFEISRAPAGPISLNAEKPGYFSPQALSEGGPVASPGTSFILSEDNRDVRLKLIPEGHIEGRITNTDNEPISGLTATVTGERIVEGWKRESSAGASSTNAAGRFRIDGLRPGRYYLATASRQMFESAGPDSGVNIGYAERFYPAAADRDSAQAIEVRAGETVEADMQLPPERFHQINGTLIGATPGDNVFVAISNGSNGGFGNGVDPKTGRFKISPVFPGVWTLTAQAMRGPASSSYGEQEVHVSDSDANDVRIEMHPGINIPLVIDTPPSALLQSAGNWMPQIQLISLNQQALQPTIWPQMDNSTPQPSRFFANVRPGSYRVTVPAIGALCAQSISSGNTDLASGLLVVQDGVAPQPIHMVLGEGCAKLTGAVSDNNGDGNGVVVLFPVSAATSPSILNTRADKSFALQELPPGDYRIFAVSDITGLEYANPQALQTIPSVEVHLEANQTAHVNVELYRREPQ